MADEYLYRVSKRVAAEGTTNDNEWTPVSKRTGGVPRAYSTLGAARGVVSYLRNDQAQRIKYRRYLGTAYEYRVERMPQVDWEHVPDPA